MIVQMEDSATIYSHDQMMPNDASHSSCGSCEESMSCSVSICNATAMFDGVVIDLSETAHLHYQHMSSFAHSMDPTLPYRPPISFS